MGGIQNSTQMFSGGMLTIIRHNQHKLIVRSESWKDLEPTRKEARPANPAWQILSDLPLSKANIKAHRSLLLS